jgi:Acyl-ACP thioesterase
MGRIYHGRCRTEQVGDFTIEGRLGAGGTAMLGTVHEYDLLIRGHHLDTFGHVNNAKYLQILEEARWDVITRNGYSLDEVASQAPTG